MTPPDSRFATRRLTLAAVAVACALAGCVTTTQTATPKPAAAPVKPPRPFSGNFITALDPCADQMQDLCGALFLYDLKKHALPARLQDLQPFADAGQELKFTCPVSGKPYIYAPTGLDAPGQNIRIYVYDAEPAHVFYNSTRNPWSNPKSYGRPDPADGGSRSCIFSKPDAATGAPTLFTDEIPERAFRQFAPSAQHAPVPQPTPPPVAAPQSGQTAPGR